MTRVFNSESLGGGPVTASVIRIKSATAESAMKRDESVTFDDPVFGVATVDQWGQDFWTLRHIPSFCPFPDSDVNDFCGVESHQKTLIENWPASIPQLSRISRISNVHDALRHRRVFEVSIERSEGQPIADDQRDAFLAFLDAESRIADIVLTAIVAYYHNLDEAERDDPLEILSEEELAHFTDGINRTNIERICAFDGISVWRPSSTNASSLVFGFEANWDVEHGFGVVWQDGRVIGCGRHDDIAETIGFGD